ncbi:hypothetical protein SAMN05443428_10575 [Caloramator quimbayensis]|uniref:Uncharacterized protein n=1 Tax=Caloramator quimbayensis TaxID=1147123 RepID=A0A1T4X195_9CLOT|nr:hypothetical protein [Caloramator quimbayensis]SKA83354.1 hypothetical protein SAMN05443428_10575 [Caloramator quimbayensis]
MDREKNKNNNNNQCSNEDIIKNLESSSLSKEEMENSEYIFWVN